MNEEIISFKGMRFKDDPYMPLPLKMAYMDSSTKYREDVSSFLRENLAGGGIQNHLSVTTLNQPPRKVQLIARRKKDIVYDILDFHFSLKGSIIHYVLEHYAPSNWMLEKRLSILRNINGEKVLIHGQADAYDPIEEKLWDWKYTSGVSASCSKPEHEKQLNVLAYIFRNNGLPVKSITNCYIIERLDLRFARDESYPKKEYMNKDYRMYPKNEILEYIDRRSEIHLNEINTPDKKLPLCTDEERWIRNNQFIVYRRKKGTKKQPIQEWSSKASARCESKEEANQWIVSNPSKEETKVVEKKGYPRACDYCQARPFCSQRQKELMAEQKPILS